MCEVDGGGRCVWLAFGGGVSLRASFFASLRSSGASTCACARLAAIARSRPAAAGPSLTYVCTSLRCRCTLIRMPVPMNRVRSAVPPYERKGSGTPTTGRMPDTMPMLTKA